MSAKMNIFELVGAIGIAPGVIDGGAWHGPRGWAAALLARLGDGVTLWEEAHIRSPQARFTGASICAMVWSPLCSSSFEEKTHSPVGLSMPVYGLSWTKKPPLASAMLRWCVWRTGLEVMLMSIKFDLSFTSDVVLAQLAERYRGFGLRFRWNHRAEIANDLGFYGRFERILAHAGTSHEREFAFKDDRGIAAP